MGYAFGHVVFSWVLAKLGRLKFNKHEWLALFFGAILPDIDYIFDWVLNVRIHRNFTHSILFLVIGVILTYFIVKFLFKKLNPKQLSIALGLGVLSHFVLDMAFGSPGINLFWPLDFRVFFFGVITNYSALPFFENYDLKKRVVLLLIDSVIGLLFFVYLTMKNKIKEF